MEYAYKHIESELSAESSIIPDVIALDQSAIESLANYVLQGEVNGKHNGELHELIQEIGEKMIDLYQVETVKVRVWFPDKKLKKNDGEQNSSEPSGGSGTGEIHTIKKS